MTQDEGRAALVKEAKRLQENCLYTSTAHFLTSSVLWRWHLALGTVPIILGTIGGWKGLSDPSLASPRAIMFGGVCSLLAGVIGSALSFWNLAETRARHATAATQYKSLENDARRAHELHAKDEEYDAFKRRIVDLGDRYNKLNESHIQTAEWAFVRARKKIQGGAYENTPQPPASGIS